MPTHLYWDVEGGNNRIRMGTQCMHHQHSANFVPSRAHQRPVSARHANKVASRPPYPWLDAPSTQRWSRPTRLDLDLDREIWIDGPKARIDSEAAVTAATTELNTRPTPGSFFATTAEAAFAKGTAL